MSPSSTPRPTQRVVAWLNKELQQELSYTITRPYNLRFRHFKLIVLSSFGALLIALTIFNYANVAFNLQPATTLNPNGTEAKREWFMSNSFTFGDDKLEPKCQSTHLSIGDEFISSNFGLRYQIERIVFRIRKKNERRDEMRTSVAYLNDTLKLCRVNQIHMELSKSDDSDPTGRSSWISWDGSASASGECSVDNKEGRSVIYFTTRYNRKHGLYNFIAVNDAVSHAALWWGARLMSLYFVSVQQVISRLLPEPTSKARYRRAVMDYNRKSLREEDTADVMSRSLFENAFWFLGEDGFINNEKSTGGKPIYNNSDYAFSRPLTEGFYFANVYRSMVLADLGGSATNNVLQNADLLRYILNPHDDFNREDDLLLGKSDWRFSGITGPPALGHSNESSTPMHEVFDEFIDETTNLTAKPATIYTQYVCQVPEKKSPATAILFTVVATMSLMQAAWAIFKWIMETRIVRGERAMWCQGCQSLDCGKNTSLESLQENDEMETLMKDSRARTA